MIRGFVWRAREIPISGFERVGAIPGIEQLGIALSVDGERCLFGRADSNDLVGTEKFFPRTVCLVLNEIGEAEKARAHGDY